MTLAWSYALCAVAAINVIAWFASARFLASRWHLYSREVFATRQVLLWLSALYVAGCAFRSALPMIDVPRLCLHDTPLSRIAFGRSIATVAELAFVTQWALLLREAGAVRASRAVLPLIALAEVLSWIAVTRKDDLFHALENATWTVAAGVAVSFLVTRWRYENETGKRVIAAAIGAGAGYIVFMIAYVVPMYLFRWYDGQETLPLRQGLAQLLGRCTVEHEWSLWWQDAAWLTPYFSLAVWLSLLLAHTPSLKRRSPM